MEDLIKVEIGRYTFYPSNNPDGEYEYKQYFFTNLRFAWNYFKNEQRPQPYFDDWTIEDNMIIALFYDEEHKGHIEIELPSAWEDYFNIYVIDYSSEKTIDYNEYKEKHDNIRYDVADPYKIVDKEGRHIGTLVIDLKV